VDTGHLHLHGDYLWHNYDIIEVRKCKFSIYCGIGARIRFGNKSGHTVDDRIRSSDDKMRFGAHGVLSLEYLFTTTPLDLFSELAPTMDLIPTSEFSLNAPLGFHDFL